jgi:hypothetical protein
MTDLTASSANTSAEEATIVTSRVLLENSAVSINTTSLTTNPQVRIEPEETSFGTHMREAAAIIKELWKRE